MQSGEEEHQGRKEGRRIGRKEGRKVRTEGWKDGSYRRERWEKEKSNHEDGKEQRKGVWVRVDGPSRGEINNEGREART